MRDPAELKRFYSETVRPLVAYDEQYETDLLGTLATFLDCDANVNATASRLITHRHTIRYRFERVRELTGLDVSSTDGREKLSLGLKAMRVLGIAAPRGPATEPGAGGGRVPRGPQSAAASGSRSASLAAARSGCDRCCARPRSSGDARSGLGAARGPRASTNAPSSAAIIPMTSSRAVSAPSPAAVNRGAPAAIQRSNTSAHASRIGSLVDDTSSAIVAIGQASS